MALWRSPDLVRGGDSVLTEHGEEYASALAEWVDKEVMGRWDGSTDRNVPYDGIYPYEINMEYITDELYSPDIYKWIICSSIYIYIPMNKLGVYDIFMGIWWFYRPRGYEWIWMNMDYGLIMDWLWNMNAYDWLEFLVRYDEMYFTNLIRVCLKMGCTFQLERCFDREKHRRFNQRWL